MICPICKKEFNNPPALSRKDNKTKICSECGIVEAINCFEPDKKKAQKLIDSILEYEKRAKEMNVQIDIHYDPEDKEKTLKLNKKE